jgi:hypothetical protein
MFLNNNFLIKQIYFIIFLFHFIFAYYPYSTNFHLFIRKNNYNPAISFMNLNDILNYNSKFNKLNITYYNNNKSILFNYNTYSYLEDYKYSNQYLLKNKNLFVAKYSFNVDYNNYKYLLLIKSNDFSNTRILWNISIKYNNIFINKNNNDKIIINFIKKCIYKKPTVIHPILSNYFNQ